MGRFEKLDVWKDAFELCVEIYNIVKNFPDDELYGLVSQMRRSSASVSINIAEGQSRDGEKEFRKFLYIAKGSLSELECQLMLAERLGYISSDYLDDIKKMIQKLDYRIFGFVKYLDKKIG